MSFNNAVPPIDVTVAERDAICRQDFLTFAYVAFAVLAPTKKLSFERLHEAIAAILATVGKGQRARHIINAPPRSLKSFWYRSPGRHIGSVTKLARKFYAPVTPKISRMRCRQSAGV
jgi:hypothetical protein